MRQRGGNVTATERELVAVRKQRDAYKDIVYAQGNSLIVISDVVKNREESIRRHCISEKGRYDDRNDLPRYLLEIRFAVAKAQGKARRILDELKGDGGKRGPL
jgi:hypothetical protein